MPFIVATYIYASSQGQRTHSARTNMICLIEHFENNSLLLTFKLTYPQTQFKITRIFSYNSISLNVNLNFGQTV
jgi:hypothetical protein